MAVLNLSVGNLFNNSMEIRYWEPKEISKMVMYPDESKKLTNNLSELGAEIPFNLLRALMIIDSIVIIRKKIYSQFCIYLFI